MITVDCGWATAKVEGADSAVLRQLSASTTPFWTVELSANDDAPLDLTVFMGSNASKLAKTQFGVEDVAPSTVLTHPSLERSIERWEQPGRVCIHGFSRQAVAVVELDGPPWRAHLDPRTSSPLFRRLALQRFLLGAFLSIAERKCIVLHASAATTGGGVTVFVGTSGAGKTTVALSEAVRHGAQLIASDSAVVDQDGVVHGIPESIRAGRGTIDGLPPFADAVAALPTRGFRSAAGVDKVAIHVTELSAVGVELVGRGPLSRVVLCSFDPQVAIEPIDDPGAALHGVLLERPRQDWVRLISPPRRDADSIARFLNKRATMCRYARPHGHDSVRRQPLC